MTGSVTPLVGAVDVGGTKIAAAVITKEGRMLASRRCPTPHEGRAEFLHAVAGLFVEVRRDVKDRYGYDDIRLFEGIGVSAPGPIDRASGRFINPPNLPQLHGFAPAIALGNMYGVPAVLEHDGKANAAGEFRWGAAKGSDDFLLVIAGTGVGAAAYRDGKLRDDPLEIGHVSVRPLGARGIKCKCGGRDCLERHASGPAIVARYRANAPGEVDAGIVCEDVARLAVAGDLFAKEAIRHAGWTMGAMLAQLRTLMPFGLVVLSGGVAEIGEPFFAPIRCEIAKNRYMPDTANIRVVASALGKDIGLYGAAARFLEEFPG